MTDKLNWKERAQELPEKYDNLDLTKEQEEKLKERYEQMQYEPGE
jgi:hypothetical protein